MLLNTLQTSMRCLRCTSVLRSQSIKTMIKKPNYSTWEERNYDDVVNEEIVLKNPATASGPRKYVNEEHRQRALKARIRHKAPKKPEQNFVSDITYKDDGTPNIIKFAEEDRSISTLVFTIKNRKMRDKNQQILLEGRRLIVDAIRAGLTPEIILFSRTTDISKLSLPERGVKLYKVPYATLQLWSNLTTSPGIIGIFKAPKSFERETTIDTLPLTIICDNVREPGNLGSILRAAAGVGCERVILTKGCVDVWESKVLRSAAGAHFRVSISKSVEWEDVKSLISPTASIYVADNDSTMNEEEIATSSEESHLSETNDSTIEKSMSASAVDDSTIENSMSASAVDDSTREKSMSASAVDDSTIEKSMSASAVDDSTIEKSMSASAVDDSTIEKSMSASAVDDSNIEKSMSASDVDETADEESDEETDDNEHEEKSYGRNQNPEKMKKVGIKELASRIPVIPYYAVDYASNEVVLIVGGETEGLSYESIAMLQNGRGVRVNVPLNNNVESLNTGMALGIVAFEIKRQFTVRKNSITK